MWSSCSNLLVDLLDLQFPGILTIIHNFIPDDGSNHLFSIHSATCQDARTLSQKGAGVTDDIVYALNDNEHIWISHLFF